MILKHINNKMDKMKGLAMLFRAQNWKNKASLEKIFEQEYLIINERYKQLV